MTSKRNFCSPEAEAVIAKILAFIKESGTATGAQVREVTGFTEHYNGSYLRYMGLQGLIHGTRQVATQGKSYPISWVAGPPPKFEGVEERDDFIQRVVVRKNWEPNNTRMDMECYLFGAPTKLQASA
jgi:hypothetical protein